MKGAGFLSKIKIGGKGMRSKLLLFHTDTSVELVNTNVVDGKASYKDKAWTVDKTTPIMLKGSLRYMPLYMVKWNSNTPVNPPTFKQTDIQPKLLKKTMDTNLLVGLLRRKISVSEKNTYMMPILGAIVGMLVTYLCIVLELIPI